MFEHSIFIIAAYGATTIILAWCALAPLVRTRRLRTRLGRALACASGDEGR